MPPKLVSAMAWGTVLVAINASAAERENRVGPATAPSGSLPETTVRIEAAEGGQPVLVRQASAGRYEVRAGKRSPTGGFYLLLKLHGVASQSLNLDLVGPPFTAWAGAYPRYVEATNDAGDVSAEGWRDFATTSSDADGLHVSARFQQDVAYVAFRRPCSQAFVDARLARLSTSKHLQRIDLGRSKEGRPLSVVVSRGAPDGAQGKPCVVAYAREHPDEQDAGWAALGMIDFLDGEEPAAETVRSRTDFVVIPMFDPDGAAAVAHENIINGFSPGTETPETRAYADWFAQKVDRGERLDLVLNLHNPPPASAYNVACPLMGPADTPIRAAEEAAHGMIRDRLLAQGYLVRKSPWATGESPLRLSGWLSRNYGSAVLPYEINSLAPKGPLDAAKLAAVGRVMAEASSEFFDSPEGRALRDEADATRSLRGETLKQMKVGFAGRSALLIESLCRKVIDGAAPATTRPAPAGDAPN